MSYNSSSSYNYGGGSGGWDNNANEVSYGDSYAAYDNDDGNDPYNLKIKDPKKEKRKKEKKEPSTLSFADQPRSRTPGGGGAFG